MSVVTKDTIQPSSGQALTIKDEGGTASITVAANGEATFAENVILTANKGLSFQNHSVTSVTGASSTTSNNILDDYEEGTIAQPLNFGSNSANQVNYNSNNSSYVKIGRLVHCHYVFDTNGETLTGTGTKKINLPFTADPTGDYTVTFAQVAIYSNAWNHKDAVLTDSGTRLYFLSGPGSSGSAFTFSSTAQRIIFRASITYHTNS